MEQWIATAVGKMHIHKITQIDLAMHMGVTDRYLSGILNGKKMPKGAESRIMKAIDELIASKS